MSPELGKFAKLCSNESMKRTTRPRWHRLLALVALLLVAACSATTKPTVCHDGGSRRSTYGLDFCEYEFGRFGVSEANFACPDPFLVVYAFANIRLCFLSESDRDLWVQSETLRTGGSTDASDGDTTAQSDVTTPID